jgi:ADP-heptose:LPS heptosyltransferase
MTGHVLVVRLDSMGDVLAAGPAIRAVANGADRVTLLAGPQGADAARLLPGVDDVITWACPWIVSPAPDVSPADVAELVERIRRAGVDGAVILTSFHQSALPTALALRLAGVRRIAAVSVDYPGSLLDVRLPDPGDAPEPVRMLTIAAGAGYQLPAGDDGRLAVRRPLPDAETGLGSGVPFVVVHPGTSAPARAYPAARWAGVIERLTADGWQVAVTGSPAERPLTAAVLGSVSATSADAVRDLAGRLTLGQLAAVLDRAAVTVVANTGPAHLSAAVGTPVVSLFAPVVPARRWAPYGVPVELLGDQHAACRDTRWVDCRIDGHPCLSSVTADDIVGAVRSLCPVNASAA